MTLIILQTMTSGVTARVTARCLKACGCRISCFAFLLSLPLVQLWNFSRVGAHNQATCRTDTGFEDALQQVQPPEPQPHQTFGEVQFETEALSDTESAVSSVPDETPQSQPQSTPQGIATPVEGSKEADSSKRPVPTPTSSPATKRPCHDSGRWLGLNGQ